MWWPGESLDEDFRATLPETQYAYCEQNAEGVGQWNAMHGQCSSSTRMELAAWVVALTRAVPVHMETDSQSMMNKAMKIIDTAHKWSRADTEYWWLNRNPFRRPWSLQKDGDLWKLAWEAVLERGPRSQTLTKVKGHVTDQQVQQGVVKGMTIRATAGQTS